MIIRNLTPKVQKIQVEEIIGGRELTLYLEPNSSTGLQGLLLLHEEELKGIIEVEEEKDIFSTISVDDIEEVEEVDVKEISENTENMLSAESISTRVSTAFICDICGEEFASQRGLTSHKNRVHNKN